jgi:DNA-binding transcriptional ArsR family regulator
MVNKVTIASYLEPFLYSKEFMHLSDIARRIGKNHTVVRLYLNQFEKQGILEKRIIGRMTMYRIKLSPLLIDYLALAEKEKLVSKCQKDLVLKEIIGFLHNYLNENNKALVFGSATLDARKAKDIDILITGEINFEENFREEEKKLNVKFHLLNTKDLESIKEALKKEILAKHIIIQGTEEVVTWLL